VYAQGASRNRAFVGRTQESSTLAQAWQSARLGRGAVCLISGEPGIGKSRLLTEFAAEAERADASVHWGLAWEAGGAPPYWPWIQILRSVLTVEHARAALNEQAHLAASIAQLVPELVPGRAETASLEPQQARFRLMDAVSTLLLATASRTPVLLILEDLHAADPDSLALLEFLTRQSHTAPLMLVGSYRDSELQRPRTGSLIERVRRNAIPLCLDRLPRDAVREYLWSAGRERPLEQTVTEVFRLTEGHPLYLAELVSLGQTRGGLRGAPSSMRTVIRERAGELPERTRALLAAASVLGRDFEPDALTELVETPLAEVDAALQPALAAGLIEPGSAGRLRFEHILVREVFHELLSLPERRALHERRARRLQERDPGNAELPWAELARHLEESGPGARTRAIAAWQKAAVQADTRAAFDDAALCYSRAIALLDEEGNAQPAARAQLLLQLAAAQIRAGDLDAGRHNSTQAFAIGENSGNTELLADAALTYGSIFTFGNVDARLVRLLQSALSVVSLDDISRRARIQARLAAAMQPAADPSEPIRLARESIQLARRTGDARTILTTLRSAISALMDLGDPAERLTLNQEYVRLAQQLNDSCECMRGYMRMIIDAMELGDAATMDHAIEQYDALAEGLGLPHYQWTAAAFRVMRATTRGEFSAADVALARARRLAERAQDSNASLTLLMQQLALAEMRGDEPQVRELAARLENRCSHLPQSDLYLKPALLAIPLRIGEPLADTDGIDEAYVRRVIQFNDMGAMVSLGEVLAARRDAALAETVYRFLVPHEARCGHWGLLGIRWSGPVARVLGMLAATTGRTAQADAHFAEALGVARRMNARAWIAYITVDWAEAAQPRREERFCALLAEAQSLAQELGMAGLLKRIAACREARTPAAPRIEASPPVAASRAQVPTVDYFRLARDGEVWLCECEGRSFRLRDSRGMQMLARLIADPGNEIHVLDLMGPGDAEQPADAGDSGELLDDRARRDYRRRLETLRSRLEDAEAMNDTAAADAAREEIEQLSDELARAFGLDGRPRRAGSVAERARVNVQRRLKHALERIGKECPAAGRHLDWAVRTGTFCSYQPE
jgi:hypothetical protein